MPLSDVDSVNVLIGNQDRSKFSDVEIQFFLDQNDESILFAAGMACDALAAKVSANLQEIQIGDFRDYSGRNQVAALQAQAQAFYKLETETPAFAIAEQDLSDFNVLVILRNYVLRSSS